MGDKLIHVGDMIYWFPPGTNGSVELQVMCVEIDIRAEVKDSEEMEKMPLPGHTIMFSRDELTAFPQCEKAWYTRAQF